MKSKLSRAWIHRFKKGPFHSIPEDNFAALDRAGTSLFNSKIKGKPIDLYVYNPDTTQLFFGRANLEGRYPRELAHHVGLVRSYLRIRPGLAEKKFSQGSLDIAVNHDKNKVYFKHLTLGLEDMIFPEDMEWITHVGSLQELAMKALREIGMPETYKKSVIKATEWARIRTGLMHGKEISYEAWKKRLRGGA